MKLLIVIGLLFLTGCNGNQLNGEWIFVTHTITDEEITFTDSSLLFENNKLFIRDSPLEFEISECENYLFIDGLGQREFAIDGNALHFMGYWEMLTHFRYGSNELEQHRQEIQEQANEELEIIIAERIAREEYERARHDAIEDANERHRISTANIIERANLAISNAENRLRIEVLELLQGEWLFRHVAWADRTERFTFNEENYTRHFQVHMRNGEEERVEGVVRVTLNSILNPQNLSNNPPNFNDFSLEEIVNWELDVDMTNELINNLENVTLSTIVHDGNSLVVELIGNGSIERTLNVEYLANGRMRTTTRAISGQREFHRQ